MVKFVKRSALFLVGLGSSVVLGKWLKDRDQADQKTAVSDSDEVGIKLDTPESTGSVEEMESITLPPEAFEDVEPVDNIVISSEMTVDTDAEDDLTTIGGIGAKTAETLKGMGIRSFAQLAEADANIIKASVSRVSLESIQGWIKEAKGRIE
ncbi:MAG: helix-hairpin-helix domain-containing protein [Chloroflexi bacterium]|nr:helix-hairpin-helix domain-containing protein [Chloroflexota bacterium]